MTLTCHYCKQMDTFDESSFWFETFFGSFEFLMAFYVQNLEYLLPFILLIIYPYSLGVELEIQRLLMYWCKSCISIKYTSKKRVKCKKKSNPFIWAPIRIHLSVATSHRNDVPFQKVDDSAKLFTNWIE